MTVHEALQEALRAATGDPDLTVVRSSPLGGGCIHSASRLSTTAGDFFAKWNADSAPGLFPSEAAGLRAMAAAESGLVVPAVVAVSGPSGDAPGFIVMEMLEVGSGRDHDERLGRGLAALHRRTRDTFGFPVTTYCGSTAQDNEPARDWPSFYAEHRLRPLLDMIARDRPLAPADRSLLERLVARLPELLALPSPPALIHGDLWSGNVLSTPRGPALFDPACSYADREMEFGITMLFGGFSERFWDAYREAWPLPPGWRERNALYRLYHLLNHHLIFGGHYGAEALTLARRFV